MKRTDPQDLQTTEPFLDEKLIEASFRGDLSQLEWHADALDCLQKQLGFANDFYYPLATVVALLRTMDAGEDDGSVAL